MELSFLFFFPHSLNINSSTAYSTPSESGRRRWPWTALLDKKTLIWFYRSSTFYITLRNTEARSIWTTSINCIMFIDVSLVARNAHSEVPFPSCCKLAVHQRAKCLLGNDSIFNRRERPKPTRLAPERRSESQPERKIKYKKRSKKHSNIKNQTTSFGSGSIMNLKCRVTKCIFVYLNLFATSEKL